MFVKSSRHQSWVNLLFSVLRDSILDSILDSLFSILDSRFVQESRIANQVENQDSQQTVNLLLNGTVGVACGGGYSGGGAAVASYKVDVLCMHDF